MTTASLTFCAGVNNLPRLFRAAYDCAATWVEWAAIGQELSIANDCFWPKAAFCERPVRVG